MGGLRYEIAYLGGLPAHTGHDFTIVPFRQARSAQWGITGRIAAIVAQDDGDGGVRLLRKSTLICYENNDGAVSCAAVRRLQRLERAVSLQDLWTRQYTENWKFARDAGGCLLICSDPGTKHGLCSKSRLLVKDMALEAWIAVSELMTRDQHSYHTVSMLVVVPDIRSTA